MTFVVPSHVEAAGESNDPGPKTRRRRRGARRAPAAPTITPNQLPTVRSDGTVRRRRRRRRRRLRASRAGRRQRPVTRPVARVFTAHELLPRGDFRPSHSAANRS